jgi:hypothetical protein
MSNTVENLILDLLEWIGRNERSYAETIEAWRTSCPRLPVWEEANDRGLVEATHSLVRLTPMGLTILRQRTPDSEALPRMATMMPDMRS